MESYNPLRLFIAGIGCKIITGLKVKSMSQICCNSTVPMSPSVEAVGLRHGCIWIGHKDTCFRYMHAPALSNNEKQAWQALLCPGETQLHVWGRERLPTVLFSIAVVQCSHFSILVTSLIHGHNSAPSGYLLSIDCSLPLCAAISARQMESEMLYSRDLRQISRCLLVWRKCHTRVEHTDVSEITLWNL